jgi:hypothetical protein
MKEALDAMQDNAGIVIFLGIFLFGIIELIVKRKDKDPQP